MNKLLKLNFGTGIAIIYLFLFLVALIESNIGRPDALSGVGLIFLTLPWSFILLELIDKSGVLASISIKALLFLITTFSALINALILHLIGYLFLKVWIFLSFKQNIGWKL
jgi:hypothetical protein